MYAPSGFCTWRTTLPTSRPPGRPGLCASAPSGSLEGDGEEQARGATPAVPCRRTPTAARVRVGGKIAAARRFAAQRQGAGRRPSERAGAHAHHPHPRSAIVHPLAARGACSSAMPTASVLIAARGAAAKAAHGPASRRSPGSSRRTWGAVVGSCAHPHASILPQPRRAPALRLPAARTRSSSRKTALVAETALVGGRKRRRGLRRHRRLYREIRSRADLSASSPSADAPVLPRRADLPLGHLALGEAGPRSATGTRGRVRRRGTRTRAAGEP